MSPRITTRQMRRARCAGRLRPAAAAPPARGIPAASRLERLRRPGGAFLVLTLALLAGGPCGAQAAAAGSAVRTPPAAAPQAAAAPPQTPVRAPVPTQARSQPASGSPAHHAAPAAAARPAAVASATAALYKRILDTQISPRRVYRVDGLQIDDEDVAINLEHGTLGLLAPVRGRETGAVFVGQGQIFVLPPSRADRLSMANFTGAPFLNESFSSAYFRYSDGALRLDAADLAQLLPAEPTGRRFAAHWRATVAALNQAQALRLLAEFLNHNRTPYFYARIAGDRLGDFDVLVDRSRREQIEIAASGFATGERHPGRRAYENVWASFPMRSARLGSRQPGATPYPGPDLRVLGYHVRTRIGPNLGLHGQAAVRFRARLSGDRVVTFSLDPHLALARVTNAAGQPLLFIQNGILRGPGAEAAGGEHAAAEPVVAVILKRPLAAGRIYTLHFRYAGHIIVATVTGLYGLENRMDWYPNRTMQPAPHDLTFIYPTGLTLLATGRRAPAADKPPAGERISHWISRRPSDLAGFNLGHFEMAAATASSPQGPVPIQVFAAPNTVTRARLADLARASAWTVEFYEQRFGPFPFPRLALTELPFPLGQGWPGLIYLARDSFLTPAQMEDRHLPPQAQALYPLMRPHEIAHQWWGNEVAWRSYHDQWLCEALASYAALLDVNAQFQAGALPRVLAYDRRQLLRKNVAGQALDSAGPLSLGIRLDSERFPHAYDVLVYDKGAWVMHMLRELMRSGPPPDAPLPPAAAHEHARRDVPPTRQTGNSAQPRRGPRQPMAASAAGARSRVTPATLAAPSPASGPRPRVEAAGPSYPPRAPLPATTAAPPPPAPADARFFAFLRAFRRAYQGRAAGTADFARVAARFVPPRLAKLGAHGGWEWFFREWVDGTGIPRYRVTELHAVRLPRSRQRGSRWALEGMLLQSRVPLTFTMPVPLYLHGRCAARQPCAPRYLGTVISQGASTEFQLPLPPAAAPGTPPQVMPPRVMPLRVMIDPYDTILRR